MRLVGMPRQGQEMSNQIKLNSLHAYQVVLYNRALHPELFGLKARKVVRHGDYELESWLMRGAHVLRFECSGKVTSELLTGQEGNLPGAGVVTAFVCQGEHDYEHAFEREKVNYITTVQTESLSDNMYHSAYEEYAEWGKEMKALSVGWTDEVGRCLSLIDVQPQHRELHAQSYHLIANGGLIVRSQTIFEQL